MILLAAFTSSVFASSLDDVMAATQKLFINDKPACSGVFVKSTPKEDLFLTAAHCVVNMPSDTIYSINREIYNEKFDVIRSDHIHLELIKTDQKNDLALLKASDSTVEFPVVDIATDNEGKSLTVRDMVAVIGYPLGRELTYTEGRVTGRVAPLFKPYGIESPMLRVTAPVAGGNSGGGVYHLSKDGAYTLIGTVTGTFPNANFMTYVTLTENINKFLAGLLDFKAVIEKAPVLINPADLR